MSTEHHVPEGDAQVLPSGVLVCPHFQLLQLLQTGKQSFLLGDHAWGCAMCAASSQEGLCSGRVSTLLFKKEEYLTLVTPGLPGLGFCFCSPGRDSLPFHFSQRFQ